MNPKDKKYILDNAAKRSPKEIAQDLGLKERRVRRFLEEGLKYQKSVKPQQAVTPPANKKAILVSIALIIILGFVTYANSVKGDFVWDDSTLVKNNRYIRDWSNIPKVFTTDIAAGAGRISNFYRPVQTLTYMADYSLWKLNTTGYHLTNIALHILAALAVFWLLNIIFKDLLIAFFAGALFVVGPMHNAVVAYISGRADSLALLFMIFSFIIYLREKKTAVIYALMLSSYACALLSKDLAIILPALLLLYHYAFRIKVKVKDFLPVALTAFIYAVLRLTVFKFSIPAVASPYAPLSDRLPGFFVALSSYLKLFFLPFDLHMEYGFVAFRFSDPMAVIGLFCLIILAAIAVICRERNRLTFFSIGWFLIALVPVSNIIHPINAYMAEHWLYLPSIGLFTLLAFGLSCAVRSKRLKAAGVVLTVSLLCFYSYISAQQNKYWRDSLVLYERTLRYSPSSPRLYYNIALEYKNRGRDEEAVKFYKKAIELKPDYADAYTNLGNIYKSRKQEAEAMGMYKKAIEINPALVEAYINLGILYMDTGKTEDAAKMFEKAIEINPGYGAAYDFLNALKGHGKR